MFVVVACCMWCLVVCCCWLVVVLPDGRLFDVCLWLLVGGYCLDIVGCCLGVGC